jgi:hypothetical protein
MYEEFTSKILNSNLRYKKRLKNTMPKIQEIEQCGVLLNPLSILFSESPKFLKKYPHKNIEVREYYNNLFKL